MTAISEQQTNLKVTLLLTTVKMFMQRYVESVQSSTDKSLLSRSFLMVESLLWRYYSNVFNLVAVVLIWVYVTLPALVA